MLPELMLIRKICGCIKFLRVQSSSQFPISEHSGVGGFDAYNKSKQSRV